MLISSWTARLFTLGLLVFAACPLDVAIRLPSCASGHPLGNTNWEGNTFCSTEGNLIKTRKWQAMGIGILTFHYSLNPGAVLQAYRLWKSLSKLGHDIRIIDYRNADSTNKYLRPCIPFKRTRWLIKKNWLSKFLALRKNLAYLRDALTKPVWTQAQLAAAAAKYDLIVGND